MISALYITGFFSYIFLAYCFYAADDINYKNETGLHKPHLVAGVFVMISFAALLLSAIFRG